MTVSVKQGRQQLIFAYQDVSFDDLTSAEETNMIYVPPGCIVKDVQVMNEVVFNSATSDVLDVGWLGGAANGLIDDHDLTAAAPGRTSAAEDVLGDTIAGGDWITATWTGVGAAPTTGRFILMVSYITLDREQFNQDNP